MDTYEIAVKKAEIDSAIETLQFETILSVDTETTGLEPFKGCKLFSIIVASRTHSYYFNFNWHNELGLEEYILGDAEKEKLKVLFMNPRLWVLQNAKFDLHFLAKEGLLPEGEYYDTQVAGRVIYNIHESYSLDAMSERELGERKDDAVMKWLEDNKCYQMVPLPGRKKMIKNYFFDQVPFEIISKYAMKDARLTYDLYLKQQQMFQPSDAPVIENEMRLIKTLYDMESTGVQLDHTYTQNAAAHNKLKIDRAISEWFEIQRTELVDSGEYLKPIFEGLGFTVPWTEKMEPNVDADVIASFDHPLARILERYRDAEKRYTTLMGLLSSADENNVVHTNFKQSGTVTGRMSSMNPNLQNLSADDENEFPIRRCFVPRPGHFFVAIDYQQMEFRLLLEYAKEHELIEKIKAGHDPHDSTAEMTGLSRKAAKTLNFGLVYGMGIKKLGKAIGVTEQEARAFKQKYFDALPGVREFLWAAAANQEKRRFTWNWLGRRFQLRDRKFSYRAPNSIIQGGCADVCKIAMNRLHEYLEKTLTVMLLQVHDEILFEVPFHEVFIVDDLKKIMETAYPHKHIPLTCSVSYSLKSFHDMIEVEKVGDIGDAVRESISSSLAAAPKGTAERVVLQS